MVLQVGILGCHFLYGLGLSFVLSLKPVAGYLFVLISVDISILFAAVRFYLIVCTRGLFSGCTKFTCCSVSDMSYGYH